MYDNLSISHFYIYFLRLVLRNVKQQAMEKLVKRMINSACYVKKSFVV